MSIPGNEHPVCELAPGVRIQAIKSWGDVVGGGLRVVVDESNCIVIEQDRMNPPRTEHFTVTNVKALVDGLQKAQEFQQNA